MKEDDDIYIDGHGWVSTTTDFVELVYPDIDESFSLMAFRQFFDTLPDLRG